MKSRRYGYVWSIAIAAFFSGCGGVQPPGGSPGSLPQASAARRAIANLVPSASYEVLHRFDAHPRRFGGARRPAYPFAGLTDVNGTLYGTTGANLYAPHACGTVYSITPGGATKILHHFHGPDGCNVETRGAGALLNVNGTLYGTAGGGAHHSGVVFSITTSGTFAVVYSFQGGYDGAQPHGALIDVNGTLYGTTFAGGGYGCPMTVTSGCGTVYNLTTGGVETVLYRFSGKPDGANPYSGLTDVNGTLYGTTNSGGAGGGTVYRVTTAGSEKVLYSFSGHPDGYSPNDLTHIKGTLYGTTAFGGSGCDCGTAYSVTTAGSEKTIYSFTGGQSDGAVPLSGLLDVHGTLYGTTLNGGSGTAFGCDTTGITGCGTVYSVTTGGSEKILHIFAAGNDGAGPTSGLVDLNGTLYGTTPDGGGSKASVCQNNGGCGIVYALTP